MSGKSTRLNPSSLRMKTGGSAACVLRFLGGFGLTRDRRSKIALYSLTVLCAFLSLVRMAFGMPQKAKASDAQNAASSIAGTVNVNTNQSQANNLAGVTVTLSGPASGAAAKSAITNESGHFQFAQLIAGTYTLEVNAEGFEPWSKTITPVAGQAAVQDATIEINAVNEKIEVQGEGIEVSTNSAELAANVSDRQLETLETLPLAEQKFTEAARAAVLLMKFLSAMDGADRYSN
jgi:Carboxypeptidase regulatory-like domain